MRQSVLWMQGGMFLISLTLVLGLHAQQAPGGKDGTDPAPGPRLVQFGGVLKDKLGRPLTGVQGVTFALYKDQEGGSPLWIETQNVMADEQGAAVSAAFQASEDTGATQTDPLPVDSKP